MTFALKKQKLSDYVAESGNYLTGAEDRLCSDVQNARTNSIVMQRKNKEDMK